MSRLFMDKYLEYINDMLRCNKEHRNDRLKLATADNADYSKISVENLKTSDGKPWKKKNRTKSPPSK